MLNLLNQHRSVRSYAERQIDPQLLNQLLETACRASNTGNMQAYSIIVTTDEEKKEQLLPAHFHQQMLVKAPVVLTFCADFNRVSTWCNHRKAEPGFNNFQSFMAAAIDSLLVAQNFCVAAESKGLGICYLGTTTYNADLIIDVLELPSLVVPVTTVTVGYPDVEIPLTDRLPLQATVHYESYKEFSKDEIDVLYCEKENNPQYRQFVVDNKKDTLAQVFTEVRYPKKNNEFFSVKFLEVLKKQGFEV